MFVPDPGFERQMRSNSQVKRARVAAAEDIAAAVRREAPKATGNYSETIEATEDDDAVRVESFDPSAHLIEWGSVNNPAYSPMRRGVASAGYRLDEAPK